MKKVTFFAICAMAATALIFALGSCKKEAQNEVTTTKNELSAQAFNPSGIKDIDAYLKNFKQKMQKSADSKDNESLSLEEAAWHLSSIANYDFGNVNVKYNDMRFDTLYAHVNILNGNILLSDLNTAYESIHADIERFYYSLPLDNKHCRFIDASISENGEITLFLMTTFNRNSRFLADTCWYFPNVYELWEACDTLFEKFYTYPAASTARWELTWALNMWEQRDTIPSEQGGDYYTVERIETFDYASNIDPFGSPFYLNSRLFASNAKLNPDIKNHMCYLFDSYLGLGDQRRLLDAIICWNVSYGEHYVYGNNLKISYHTLTVYYGRLTHHSGGGGNDL